MRRSNTRSDLLVSRLLLQRAATREGVAGLSKMEVTHVYQGHSGTGSLRLAPVSPEQGMK